MMTPDKLYEIRSENVELLTSLGFKTNTALPILDISNSLRSTEEIGMRINILHVLYAMNLEGAGSLKFFSELIKSEGWGKYLSQHEKTLLNKRKLSQQELIDLSWYKESAFSLLWSSCRKVKAGKILELQEIDISDFYSLMPPELAMSQFLQSLELKDSSLLYKALDYYYILHWLSKHNNGNTSWIAKFGFNNRKGLMLSESLIRERRKALEWVVYEDLDWDNVSLDT